MYFYSLLVYLKTLFLREFKFFSHKPFIVFILLFCIFLGACSKDSGSDSSLGGKTATHIAAGGSHTCAILNDGSVDCWGSDWSSILHVRNYKKDFKFL